MTINEILARHGLTQDDIAHIYPHGKHDDGEPVVCDYIECEPDYAFVLHDDREIFWEHVLQPTGFEIIGYYPDPGVYLVKRKAPEVIEVTATMDYDILRGWIGDSLDAVCSVHEFRGMNDE